jgi:hypothetical protein
LNGFCAEIDAVGAKLNTLALGLRASDMLVLVAALIAMSAATSARALDNYAEAQMDNPVAPATTAPAEPSDGVKKAEPATEQPKTSFWAHNRSIMYMTEDGTRRQIYYDDPRPGLKEVGVKKGTVLFDGVVDGATLSGTAFVFAKECDPLSFAVTGILTRDGKRITLNGKAPRIGTQCRIVGGKQEELIFDFFK